MARKTTGGDREGTGRGMEPFLLLELAAGPRHGYDLARTMGALGFRRAADDPSVVYKVLRALRANGWLASDWSVGEDQPPRRPYRLTAEGEARLHERAADLARQARRIETFFARYRERAGTEADPVGEHRPSGSR